MKIKIYAEIEVPVDECFSRTDYVSITLKDEAILEIAKAITAVQELPQMNEASSSLDEAVLEMIAKKKLGDNAA